MILIFCSYCRLKIFKAVVPASSAPVPQLFNTECLCWAHLKNRSENGEIKWVQAAEVLPSFPVLWRTGTCADWFGLGLVVFSLLLPWLLLLPVHGLTWLRISLWCWLYLKQYTVPKVKFQEIIEEEKVFPRDCAESMLINFGNVFLNFYLVFLSKSSTVRSLQRLQSIISQIMITWDIQNNKINRCCSWFLYWAELICFYWGKVGPWWEFTISPLCDTVWGFFPIYSNIKMLGLKTWCQNFPW